MTSKGTFQFITSNPPNNAQGMLWMADFYYEDTFWIQPISKAVNSLYLYYHKR